MEMTEAQKLLATGITSAILLVSPLFVLMWKQRHYNYPASARVARIILFTVLFKELMAGIMHTLFPYDSHRFISHLPQGLGIPLDEKNGGFTGLAMMTAIMGHHEIAVSFLCAIPFVVADRELVVTTYVLIVTCMAKLLVHVNMHTGLISSVHSNLPGYMRDKSSSEYATKSPPGAHVGLVELVLLVVAVVMAVVGMIKMKKMNTESEGEDGGKKIQ